MTMEPTKLRDRCLLENLRILLVEPDSAIANIITFFLESEGAWVQVLDRAETALNVIQQIKPNLILCDINLPDTDGYSFLQRVKQLKLEQSSSTFDNETTIKAIAIVLHPLRVNRQRAIEAGFHNFLFEPTEYSSLMMAIAS